MLSLRGHLIIILTFYFTTLLASNSETMATKSTTDAAPHQPTKRKHNSIDEDEDVVESSRETKTTKSTIDAAPRIFENKDAIGSVMHFLGIKSLVTLGSCNKQLKKYMTTEVEYRKQLFVSYRSEFERILAPPSDNTSREDILRAAKIYHQAQRLIDDELDFLQQYRPRRNKFFVKEQGQFLRNERAYPPEHPTFYMLPICFYMPPNRELLLPTEEDLDQAQGRAGWLWGAEDHMGSFYEIVGTDNEEYGHPKFPFRML